jgi:large subunit ribosomal protein L22e
MSVKASLKTKTEQAPAQSPKGKPKAVPKSKANKKKQDVKFVVECAKPLGDDLIKLPDFVSFSIRYNRIVFQVDFLKERIKYKGKKGQLESAGIEVKQSGTQVIVTSKSEFSKRYLKYLTKKYIKRHSLRDWIRVIASKKEVYEMRYFKIQNEDKDDNEEE